MTIAQASDIQNEAKELLRLRKYMWSVLAKQTGKTPEQVLGLQRLRAEDSASSPFFFSLSLSLSSQIHDTLHLLLIAPLCRRRRRAGGIGSRFPRILRVIDTFCPTRPRTMA